MTHRVLMRAELLKHIADEQSVLILLPPLSTDEHFIWHMPVEDIV